jgi:NTE family protein
LSAAPSEKPVTALVLSAGGMFGAYQAGAWKALAPVFRPDLVVGASIGAVNGWAIAAGCDPDELIRRWLSLECAEHYRWKLPMSGWSGLLDSQPVRDRIREMCESFQPRIDFAVVLTDLLKLRPCIFRGREVSWQHLAATTAIIGLFDQVRISGRIYTDGGLLAAVPLWAAAELGATNAVVIDALPEAPGWIAKTFVRAARRLSPFRAVLPQKINVVRVAPPALLGSPLDAIYWKRQKAEQWIRAGERDAAALEPSIAKLALEMPG